MKLNLNLCIYNLINLTSSKGGREIVGLEAFHLGFDDD